MNLRHFRIPGIVVLFLLGISATGGGLAFILNPTGSLLRIPREFLAGTPFDNYLLPGILLVLFNGVSSLTIAVLAILKKTYYPILMVAQGCILLIWLTVQLVLNPQFYYPPMHFACYTMGGLLIVMGYRLRLGE